MPFNIVGKYSGLYVSGDMDSGGKHKLVSKRKQAIQFPTEEEAKAWFIKNRVASFVIISTEKIHVITEQSPVN